MPAEHRRKIATDSALMLLANFASSGFGFVRGFYIARLLAPAEFGLWSLAAAAYNYANFADLGLNNGLILETGRQVGRGREDAAENALRQGAAGTLLITGAVALAGFAASFLPFVPAGPVAWVVRAVSVSALVLGIANFYQVAARVRHRFAGISVSAVATGAVTLAATFAVGHFVFRDRVAALVLASAVGSLAAILCLVFVARSSVAWPVRPRELGALIRLGVPMTLVPVLFTAFQSVDRWVIAGSVSADELGYYGFGVTIGQFLNMVPNTLAVVLFARQIERFGATGDQRSGASLLVPPLFLSAYAMAIVGGSVTMVMPYLVQFLVPAYSAAQTIVLLQVAGNCLLFAAPLVANYLVSIDRQSRILAWLAGATAAKALLVGILGHFLGINGAGIAVVAADLVYTAALALVASSMLGLSPGASARRLAALMVPFAVCLPAAQLIGGYFSVPAELSSAALQWLLAEAVFLAIAVPVCAGLALGSGVFAGYLPRFARRTP